MLVAAQMFGDSLAIYEHFHRLHNNQHPDPILSHLNQVRTLTL
jgi:hypothetical protein